MNIEPLAQPTSFSTLQPGSVLLMPWASRRMVYAIKAFAAEGDDAREYKVVTLGSVQEGDEGIPSVYGLSARGQSPVIDLTSACQLVPSLDPPDLLAQLPADSDTCGMVLLLRDRTLLAAKEHLPGGSWRVAHLDLATGELVFFQPREPVVATRRWALVGLGNERRLLFEYPSRPRK